MSQIYREWERNVQKCKMHVQGVQKLLVLLINYASWSFRQFSFNLRRGVNGKVFWNYKFAFKSIFFSSPFQFLQLLEGITRSFTVKVSTGVETGSSDWNFF